MYATSIFTTRCSYPGADPEKVGGLEDGRDLGYEVSASRKLNTLTLHDSFSQFRLQCRM